MILPNIARLLNLAFLEGLICFESIRIGSRAPYPMRMAFCRCRVLAQFTADVFNRPINSTNTNETKTSRCTHDSTIMESLAGSYSPPYYMLSYCHWNISPSQRGSSMQDHYVAQLCLIASQHWWRFHWNEVTASILDRSLRWTHPLDWLTVISVTSSWVFGKSSDTTSAPRGRRQRVDWIQVRIWWKTASLQVRCDYIFRVSGTANLFHHSGN